MNEYLMPSEPRQIRHPELKSERDVLRQEGRCICGPRKGLTNVGRFGVEHGPVVRGGKCQRCLDVWEKSK